MEKNNNKPKLRFPGFTDTWEQRKFDEEVEFYSGLTYSPNDVSDNGTFVLRSSNVKNGEIVGADNVYVSSEVVNSSNVKEGDIIVVVRNGSRSLIGKHAQIKRKMDKTVIGAFMTGIRSNQSSFINALMDTQQFREEIEKNLGATINQITNGMFRKMRFMFPDIQEQNQIGNFFSNLDNLITLHNRKLNHLQDKKKSLLQKMFPKSGEDFPELRFQGFTDPWEQRKLKDVATFINGRAYSQDELLSTGKYEVLRVGNFHTNNSWYYSDLELADKYYANEGDLLYTWSAAFGPHIWHGDKVIYHYHIWKIELSEEVEKNFVFHLLEYDKAKITSDKNGSTMVHITKEGMENKLVVIPNVDEQKKISAFLDYFDNLITLHERKLNHLQEQKKALLQQMFV